MWYLWNFYKTFGTHYESDYPYTGNDATCKYDESTINTSTNQVTGQAEVQSSNPQAMLDALQDRPLAIAVAAGNGYDWYKSGIVSSSSFSCAS